MEIEGVVRQQSATGGRGSRVGVGGCGRGDEGEGQRWSAAAAAVAAVVEVARWGWERGR